MSREYGNYEKYEKNSIEEEVEKGETDLGFDKFVKNNKDLQRRI